MLIAVPMVSMAIQACSVFLVTATASNALGLPALNAMCVILRMTLLTEWVLSTARSHAVLDIHWML